MDKFDTLTTAIDFKLKEIHQNLTKLTFSFQPQTTTEVVNVQPSTIKETDKEIYYIIILTLLAILIILSFSFVIFKCVAYERLPDPFNV